MIGPGTAEVNYEFIIITGQHQEGLLAGIRTLFYRFMLISKTIIFTVVFFLTVYNSDPNTTQIPLAVWGVRIHTGLIPSICAFIAFIMMYKWYDLIGEKQELLKPRLRELKL